MDKKEQYQVVINHEEQYRIWPVGKKLERGMRLAGKEGTKLECQAYIDEVWKGGKPRSLNG